MCGYIDTAGKMLSPLFVNRFKDWKFKPCWKGYVSGFQMQVFFMILVARIMAVKCLAWELLDIGS